MSAEQQVPPAVVVQGGKVPGDVPSSGGPPPAPRGGGRKHRRISNYLLDKGLQLRYVLAVTVVSALIAASLGYLIYRQEHRASDDLVQGLEELTGGDATLAEYGRETADDIARRDRRLVLEMVGVGLGLTVILSGYLIIMTHKVAGPLYKIGIYMEDMADGRLRDITPLRKGDMLQDFYGQFSEAHHAVRDRLRGDAEVMEAFATAWAAAPGEPSAAAADELDELRRHVAARKTALS